MIVHCRRSGFSRDLMAIDAMELLLKKGFKSAHLRDGCRGMESLRSLIEHSPCPLSEQTTWAIAFTCDMMPFQLMGAVIREGQ